MVKPVFKATKSKAVAQYSVEVEAGSYIYREGDLGTEMYIIQEGKIALERHFRGQEKRLAVLARGEFFGEMAVLEHLPRSASARALLACRLLVLNGATLDQMVRQSPEIAVRMLRKLSRRLRETDLLLQENFEEAVQEAEGEAVVEGEDAQPGVALEKLVHVDPAIEFPLSLGPETSIGRRDPVTGIEPDIDLTPADTQRSISRRHAKILRRGDQFFVREEIGTMNGTFVNGERIETGVAVEFHHGDEVRFGLIKTTFFRQ
jgi:CRP-like cAMP-binding protein